MKRLSGTDALFLTMETPSWHQHIAGLTVLDPSTAEDFSYRKAVDRLAERLPLAPKFTWKLKEVPFDLDRPVWVEDTAFDLERHVRRIGVPEPGGMHETAEMLGQIMSRQLDRRIPLWEWWYLDGIQNGLVAMVLKFHHCLLDGVSGASLSTVLMDLEPDATEPAMAEATPAGAGYEPSSWELLARSIFPNSRMPLAMTQYGAQLMRRGVALLGYQQSTDAPLPVSGAPRTRWNAKVGPRRSSAFASVALDDIKKVRKKFDVKVNDVVLAICGGAMLTYLEKHDEVPDGALVASVPVSTRGAGDTELDNKIANMIVSLATDVADPIERLQTIAINSRNAKGMTEAMLAKRIQSIGETAPPLVLNRAIKGLYATGALSAIPTVVNTVISNVPGPPIPLYFAGARATGMFPGSVILETMGLNITVLSYETRVDFGLAADPELVPDLWHMAEAIPAALHELMKAGRLGKPTSVADAFGA